MLRQFDDQCTSGFWHVFLSNREIPIDGSYSAMFHGMEKFERYSVRSLVFRVSRAISQQIKESNALSS